MGKNAVCSIPEQVWIVNIHTTVVKMNLTGQEMDMATCFKEKEGKMLRSYSS